jgi:hypothetical protein
MKQDLILSLTPGLQYAECLLADAAVPNILALAQELQERPRFTEVLGFDDANMLD